MALPILQTLVGFIFVLVGVAMANKPPATKREQWLYRGIFIFLGFLFVCQAWIQFRSEQRKEAQFKETMLALENKALHANPSMARHPSQEEIGLIKSNLLGLRQKYYSLLSELETNTSIDPNFQERVIVTKTKFKRDTGISNQAQAK